MFFTTFQDPVTHKWHSYTTTRVDLGDGISATRYHMLGPFDELWQLTDAQHDYIRGTPDARPISEGR